MTFLSRIPYIPPSYEFMAQHNALIEGTTEAMYAAGVACVQDLHDS
jgi:hypothetical protein